MNNCINCAKRSVCMVLAHITRFLLDYGPRFENEPGHAAIEDWEKFLGGRCVEHDDGKKE